MNEQIIHDLLIIFILTALGAFLLNIIVSDGQRYYVKRIIVPVPADIAFNFLNSLHNWESWSPFESNSTKVRIIDGPKEGVGSRYLWKRNSVFGNGYTEIIKSTFPSEIVFGVKIETPYKLSFSMQFEFIPIGHSTEIIWSASGRLPIVGRILRSFTNLEKFYGNYMEKGLLNIKKYLEDLYQ